MVDIRIIKDDRQIDLDALEAAGEEWTAGWVRQRLDGDDPFVPINIRQDENPSDLLLYLLRRYGVAREGTRYIAHSIIRILSENPGSRAWRRVLDILQRYRIPSARDYFVGFLSVAAADFASAQTSAGGLETAKLLLRAAVVQARGIADEIAFAYWLNLLERPEVSSIALGALSAMPADRLRHLGIWWRAMADEPRRDRELEEIIRSALRSSAEFDLIQTFRSASRDWPTSLRDNVNAVFAKLGINASLTGASPRQRTGSYSTALSGAAQL